MNIQATKTMAQAINKALKAKGWKGYRVEQIMLTSQAYAWNVGDIYDAEDYGDYCDLNNKYRALRVIYPAEYYACDKYLTTQDLNRIFEKGDTLEAFMAKVLDEIEI